MGTSGFQPDIMITNFTEQVQWELVNESIKGAEMEVEIRTAESEDRDQCLLLLALLADAAGGSTSSDWKKAGYVEEMEGIAGIVFENLIDGSRGEVLVAEEAGAILGMASVSYNLAMRYGGEYCQLEELIVDPAARGKNVGRLLLQTTVERAKARGCSDYGLYLVKSTEHNRPFYEKYGFKFVGSEMRQRL